MKPVLHKASLYLGITLASTLLGLTIGMVNASWLEPTLSPPQGNISAPLNSSGLGQRKGGPLFLGVNGTDMSLVAFTAVGIGSNNTDDYLNHGLGGPTGGLDISFAGNDTYPSTLILGADQGGTIRTTGVEKAFWVSMPPLISANRLTSVIGGLNTNGSNQLYIGGGSSRLAGVNVIKFFTATDPTAQNQDQNITFGGAVTGPHHTEAMSITAPRDGQLFGDVVLNGQLRMLGGLPGDGKVLVSDSAGLARWGDQPPGGFLNFVMFGRDTATSNISGVWSACASSVCTFVSAGNWKWIVPAGITKIMVETWGGGGGGRRMNCGGGSATGAGGGGGGYAMGVYAIGESSYQVIVGNVGGTTSAGGTSSLAPQSTPAVFLISATGGATASSGGVPGAPGSGRGQFSLTGEFGYALPSGAGTNMSLLRGGSSPRGGVGGAYGLWNGEAPGGGGGIDYSNCVNGTGGMGRVVIWW